MGYRKDGLWEISTVNNLKEFGAYTVNCRVFWDTEDTQSKMGDWLDVIVIARNNYEAEDIAKEFLESGRSGWNVKKVGRATAKRDCSVIVPGDIVL